MKYFDRCFLSTVKLGTYVIFFFYFFIFFPPSFFTSSSIIDKIFLILTFFLPKILCFPRQILYVDRKNASLIFFPYQMIIQNYGKVSFIGWEQEIDSFRQAIYSENDKIFIFYKIYNYSVFMFNDPNSTDQISYQTPYYDHPHFSDCLSSN